MQLKWRREPLAHAPRERQRHQTVTWLTVQHVIALACCNASSAGRRCRLDRSDFENLSEETRAKLVAAKTPEEILAVAKSEGIKLSEEDLEAVSGGGKWSLSLEPCDFC